MRRTVNGLALIQMLVFGVAEESGAVPADKCLREPMVGIERRQVPVRHEGRRKTGGPLPRLVLPMAEEDADAPARKAM